MHRLANSILVLAVMGLGFSRLAARLDHSLVANATLNDGTCQDPPDNGKGCQ